MIITGVFRYFGVIIVFCSQIPLKLTSNFNLLAAEAKAELAQRLDPSGFYIRFRFFFGFVYVYAISIFPPPNITFGAVSLFYF